MLNDLSLLLEAHPQPTFAVDDAGRVTLWNPAIAALTGRSAAEVVGQRAWKGFSEKRIALPVDDVISDGESVSAAFTFQPRRGEPVKVTFSAAPLIGANGETRGAVCSLAAAQEEDDLNFREALEGASVALMAVDRDLAITYANKATIDLVRKNLTDFQRQYPWLNPDNLMGTCIDRFHKDPSHQRRLLSDPSRLPHTAQIPVGTLTFRITVTAIRNASGAHTGNLLEWIDVTEARKATNRAAMMHSMAEGSGTCIMMCDRDRKITYANPALVAMLSRHASELRRVLPSFDTHNLLGVCIDAFHKSPAHQARLLNDTANLPYKSEIKVGSLEFGLNASALYDASGNHIGNSVEWTDLNARARYQREVQSVYTAVQEGSLSVRGNVNAVDEVYKPMLASINEIIDAAIAPINEIQDKLARVAEGDLTAYVDGNYKGDHAKLKEALNLTLDSLNQILAEVQGTAGEIASGAGQVASAAQSLSDGATRQASAVEEITASITEMTEQTRQNAENATQASHLATAAGEFASKGDERMKSMVKAMGEIEESSQNISKIIKVIDEIAFQTNLLALNAAVEAARAGAHGKGFAVVAEEVRNLAARSANAAKETTAMIEGSIRKVNQGTHIAEETAAALTRIVESVTKATDLVAEIAAASNEQAQGIAQIDQGLRQVDQVTQQNTAGAEESAAASDELSSQATRLREMLQRFTLRKKSALRSPEITPELLAAVQAVLAQQGLGHMLPQSPPQPQPNSRGRAIQSVAPAAGRVARPRHTPPKSAPPKSTTPKRISSNGSDPASVIPLDDDEFGRY